MIEAAIGSAFIRHLDASDVAFRPGLGAGIFQNYQMKSVLRLHTLRRAIRQAAGGAA